MSVTFAVPPSLALWRDRQGNLSWPRVTALALSLLPALWFLGRIGLHNLGARPVTTAIHFSGDWTVRLLVATLAVTPLVAALRQPRLVPMRRILGVAVFAWILAHFTLYIVDQHFNLVVVAQEIVKRIYLTIGFVALLMLAALAATSTDQAISRLGAQQWKRLHQLVYAIAILGLVHFFMQSKADVTEPTLMAGLILWLFVMRQPKRFGLTLSPAVIVACGIVAAILTACGEALYFHIKVGADFSEVFSADFDFSESLRPCWWPLIASVVFAAGVAAQRIWKGAGKSAPIATRLRDALI
jgi:sulfoxide reductase heme-binding subunit YedZ